MDKEIKARWVAALRSGEYKQGHGALRGADCFCCLGVLADVAVPGAWDDNGDDIYKCQNKGGDELLDSNLAHDLGLPTLGDGSQDNLSTMNDDGATFAEIADHIDRAL